MRLMPFVLAMALIVPLPVQAVPVAGEAAQLAKLSEMIKLAKEEIKKAKEQLEEYQATHETLSKARDTLKELQQEYEFVNDFDPEAELNSLLDDGVGLGDAFSINDFLEAKDGKERVDLLIKELDKHVKGASPEDKAELLRLKKQRDMAEALRDYYAKNGLNSKSQTPSDKDLQLMTASSTAVLASEAMERKMQALELEIQVQENRIKEIEYQNGMLHFFREHH